MEKERKELPIKERNRDTGVELWIYIKKNTSNI